MSLISMTGFGQTRMESEIGELQVELKSVNSRFADISVYLPKEFSSFEIPIREKIKSKLKRGKIGCSVRWSKPEDVDCKITLNKPLVEAYKQQIEDLQKEWNVNSDLPWLDLLKLPGAVTIEQSELENEKTEEALNSVLDQALNVIHETRLKEGLALRDALSSEIEMLQNSVDSIEGRKDEVVESYRERLVKLVEDFKKRNPENLDDGRIEMEVMLFADKSDITEELVRLKAHLKTFEEHLSTDNGQEKGKALEFLGQEILRETNTIGSKCRNTDVSSIVVEMKQAIERIREQNANVL